VSFMLWVNNIMNVAQVCAFPFRAGVSEFSLFTDLQSIHHHIFKRIGVTVCPVPALSRIYFGVETSDQANAHQSVIVSHRVETRS